MRPTLKLLDDALIRRIIDEAWGVLDALGVTVADEECVTLLCERGARVEEGRVRIPGTLAETAVSTTPSTFRVYDSLGSESIHFGAGRTHFAPGSSAIHILDEGSGEIRPPTTTDFVRFAKLASVLPRLDAQSTALVPADVPEQISDSYRLYLSLLHCDKPVITGAFSIEGWSVMRDLLLAVRGSGEDLQDRPLAVFTCCPTAPLRWTDVSARNLIDCARAAIPIEIVPVPLTGFMAPVTLVGTLIQQTAEILSGLVMAQAARPGTPVLCGTSPAIFDIRFETTPMGAIETMMLACAASEISHHLGLPSQAYIALSDAKQLDAQAGLETSMGAALAVLSGIDSVSGPGMLDFESCQSLGKLVVDHEICRMTDRLVAGLEPRDDFPALPLLRELLADRHLLIADHTRRHLRHEISFPGAAIDRAGQARWREEGAHSLIERAAAEATRLIGEAPPSQLPDQSKAALTEVMAAAARTAGITALPPQGQ